MAAASICAAAAAASTGVSMLRWRSWDAKQLYKRSAFSVSAQQQEIQEDVKSSEMGGGEEATKQKQATTATVKPLRTVEPQVNVKNKNMEKDYGGQWLSSTTRHVRIYAAYIDPETCAFDQTQMDKLTLILDPTDEFLWTDETCNKVYSYFQELVDHYEVPCLSYMHNQNFSLEMINKLHE